MRELPQEPVDAVRLNSFYNLCCGRDARTTWRGEARPAGPPAYTAAKTHEIHFRKIAPGLKMEHFELRPDGGDTCIFQVTP